MTSPARRARADAPGELNLQRTRKVYLIDGDVFVKDLKTGAVRQITRTEEAESDPHFLADGRRIWFHRGKDVFLHDLDAGVTWLAADLRLAKDPAEKEPKYLSEQQTRLFDVIRQKQEREKTKQGLRKKCCGKGRKGHQQTAGDKDDFVFSVDHSL